MLKRTEGIVLRTIPFSEADLIVTYLTSDFGLMRLFAKSPRKIKSRFGSSLEPLTQSKISFWGKEDANLPKLTQSDIIHAFHRIRDTLRCFLKISEIIELTLGFIPEREVNKKVYYLLLGTLQAIEGDSSLTHLNDILERDVLSENLAILHFKIKFLRFTGYSPKLDACGRCGKRGYCFYVSSGSVLCGSCVEGIDSPLRITPAILRLYNDLLSWDTGKIKRIRPAEKLLSDLSDIMDLHIRYILSNPLKTDSFMRSVYVK
jgi:DNA repair protein RecO (recombination protein O)